VAGEGEVSLTPQSTAITAPDGQREEMRMDEDVRLPPQPQGIYVLALEDDKGFWSDRIRNDLGSHDISCEVVSKLSHFTDALQRHEYDVASIDWALDRTGEDELDEDGTYVLSLLQEKNPAIGKVVFSAFMGDPADKREALDYGADYVVEKQGMGNDEGYVEAVLEAARLNLFRRVLEHLRYIGRRTEQFGEGRSEELTDELERNLYAEALDALMASFLEGEEDEVLMNLAKRRGALREFDSPRYISLPFHAKLAELLDYVRVTPEQLSRILEVDTDTAERLLSGEKALSLGEQEQNVYRLASILDFVMRLANDEPDMMPKFWTDRHRYKENKNSPPWDPEGLRDYLTAKGASGLKEALLWIRRY
jgi:hypothetical protein